MAFKNDYEGNEKGHFDAGDEIESLQDALSKADTSMRDLIRSCRDFSIAVHSSPGCDKYDVKPEDLTVFDEAVKGGQIAFNKTVTPSSFYDNGWARDWTKVEDLEEEIIKYELLVWRRSELSEVLLLSFGPDNDFINGLQKRVNGKTKEMFLSISCVALDLIKPGLSLLSTIHGEEKEVDGMRKGLILVGTEELSETITDDLDEICEKLNT